MSETNDASRPFGWEADAINEAFAQTGIRFHGSNADALAQFKAGDREITFDADGKPLARYDSQELPLADALSRWAADADDGVCDRRTLPRNPGGGRSGVACKADLVDFKAKSAFIQEHGLQAFAALPATRPQSTELKYQDDFRKLPTSEKTRLVRQYGSGFIEKLPPRPSGQPFGGYINRAALAKLQSVRPNSR